MDIELNFAPRTEWQTRIDLAASYRLCALFGWDDLIHTQITASVQEHPGLILVKRGGQRFDEVCASSLVKVPAALGAHALHAAVHAARPDAGCVMHLHNPHAIAVGMQEQGMLPLSQHALRLYGQVAYHDYEGALFGQLECARVVARLRGRPAMLLRNHGSLVCGRSVAEAFVLMAALDKACAIQLMAQASGARLHSPGPDVCRQAQTDLASDGEMEWAALLRKLDGIDASYRG
jgi:ribulose-5-phosphate 4-epimerase/fuculose-1-phosphate aldolase